MTVNEIKAAVDAGKQVFWSNLNYEVIKDKVGQYLIHSKCNNHQHFEMEDGSEWLVLDDDEADELPREEIEDSLWAFNPDFIVRHMPNLGKLTKKQESDLIGALGQIQSLCEDCNPLFAAIIEDMDDAIASDGRGHFLARYDDVEVELENGLYAYRID